MLLSYGQSGNTNLELHNKHCPAHMSGTGSLSIRVEAEGNVKKVDNERVFPRDAMGFESYIRSTLRTVRLEAKSQSSYKVKAVAPMCG